MQVADYVDNWLFAECVYGILPLHWPASRVYFDFFKKLADFRGGEFRQSINAEPAPAAKAHVAPEPLWSLMSPFVIVSRPTLR